MNLRRSKAVRAAASVAALAVLIGPSAAGAWAQESPSPSPSPEATTTDEAAEDAAHDDGKHKPTIPKDNIFSLGQSMQIRVNADGEQNAKLVNFRWSVSHLTIQGPPDGSKDGDYVVPVPEGGTLPRYLENFGFIHVENGYGQWDMHVENGWDTQRSVSIFPQDATPNISLKTEFTLDGEPVKAQDIVGKDGLVTATYTLINNTTKSYDLTVKDLSGADVQTTAEGDSPMVAITKTLLPQRYIGLNTGAGIFGADGRGNNQVQWISLPFKPLAENSQASFGWAAYVTDAVIPSLLTQVSPLYIPAHPPGEEPVEEEAASTSTPIPLDPAVAEIQAGLTQVIDGLALLTADDGSGDPLTGIETRLNDFFVSFGTDLQSAAALLDPANPDGVTYLLAQVVPVLDEVTPIVGEVDTILDAILPVLDLVSKVPGVALADLFNAQGIDDALAASLADCTAANSDGTWSTPEANCVTAAAGAAVESLDAAAASIDILAPLLAELTPLANTLLTALTGLGEDLKTISAGLEPVDLPTVDAVVGSVVASILASPGGQSVTAGMDQLSAGVAQAKSIIAAYVSELVAEVQAAVAAGSSAANEAIIHARGSIGALKAAAAESPLIYGPLPPGMPEGTVLAGAYEFRIDAADTNHPYTLPRILIGLIALIAAGFVGKYLGNRNQAA